MWSRCILSGNYFNRDIWELVSLWEIFTRLCEPCEKFLHKNKSWLIVEVLKKKFLLVNTSFDTDIFQKPSNKFWKILFKGNHLEINTCYTDSTRSFWAVHHAPFLPLVARFHGLRLCKHCGWRLAHSIILLYSHLKACCAVGAGGNRKSPNLMYRRRAAVPEPNLSIRAGSYQQIGSKACWINGGGA